MTPIIDINVQAYRAIAKAATTVLEGTEFWRNSSYVGNKPVRKALVKPTNKQFHIAFEVDDSGQVNTVNVCFEVRHVGLPSHAATHCVDVDEFLKYDIKAEDFK